MLPLSARTRAVPSFFVVRGLRLGQRRIGGVGDLFDFHLERFAGGAFGAPAAGRVFARALPGYLESGTLRNASPFELRARLWLARPAKARATR